MNNPILSKLAQGVAGMQNLQNSPMAMLVRLVQSKGDPMAFLAQMGGAQAQEAMNLIGGKSADQLRETAMKMAQERGTSIEAIAQQLGLTLPK